MFQIIILVETALHKFSFVFSGASLVIPTAVMTPRESKIFCLTISVVALAVVTSWELSCDQRGEMGGNEVD